MTTVSVSPKYQIVIPKKVREALRIQPGQKFQVLLVGDQIALVPVRPIESLRGFLAGIDPTIEREDDRL